MIPGLIALFSILFLGGPGEIFYVDKFEKGVKKYVLEKERKKEILADIKYTKALFKDFEKERKKDYKQFMDLYTDRNTSIEVLDAFFEDLQKSRAVFQGNIVDQRLLIFAKLKQEEWDQIVETSETVAEKRLAKIEKKEAKGNKELFAKTKAQIETTISSSEIKTKILTELESVQNDAITLENFLISINSAQNNILADKNSGKEQLLEIVIEDNEIRKSLIKSLVSFHKLAADHCSDQEWDKIVKTFSKEMQMSSK